MEHISLSLESSPLRTPLSHLPTLYMREGVVVHSVLPLLPWKGAGTQSDTPRDSRSA